MARSAYFAFRCTLCAYACAAPRAARLLAASCRRCYLPLPTATFPYPAWHGYLGSRPHVTNGDSTFPHCAHLTPPHKSHPSHPHRHPTYPLWWLPHHHRAFDSPHTFARRRLRDLTRHAYHLPRAPALLHAPPITVRCHFTPTEHCVCLQPHPPLGAFNRYYCARCAYAYSGIYTFTALATPHLCAACEHRVPTGIYHTTVCCHFTAATRQHYRAP